jgi:molybdate transport repressor ModE-like protein
MLFFRMTARSNSFRMSGVELRHLIALSEVARAGSLAAAARTLGYSQPAIGQQIAALERLAGIRLVERRSGARTITLTEAGERLLSHGEVLLARARSADAEIAALRDGVSGTVLLGSVASVGARVVPRLLLALRTEAPEIALQLVEDGWDAALLDLLEGAELDLAFAFAPLPANRPFSSTEVMRDPYVLVVGSETPLAAVPGPLPLDRIAREDLLVCSQSTAVESFCHAHGIAPNIRHRIEDNQTLVSLAAAGIGAAFLPRLAVDPQRTDVIQVELETSPPPRLIHLVWHEDRSLSERVRTVRRLASQVCRELQTSEQHEIGQAGDR